eukprot:IDg19961t1
MIHECSDNVIRATLRAILLPRISKSDPQISRAAYDFKTAFIHLNPIHGCKWALDCISIKIQRPPTHTSTVHYWCRKRTSLYAFLRGTCAAQHADACEHRYGLSRELHCAKTTAPILLDVLQDQKFYCEMHNRFAPLEVAFGAAAAMISESPSV